MLMDLSKKIESIFIGEIVQKDYSLKIIQQNDSRIQIFFETVGELLYCK